MFSFVKNKSLCILINNLIVTKKLCGKKTLVIFAATQK